MHRAIKIGVAVFLLTAKLLNSAEMPRSLREAERLYQSGNYVEAYEKAKVFNDRYPSNLQALIILGMSDFYLNDFGSSKKWLSQADKLSPKHPIVTKYLDLLDELEYRSGKFSSKGSEPSSKDVEDPMVTAKFFKRGYFSNAFPNESEANDPGASTKLLDPVIITNSLGTESMRLPSVLALPIPHPTKESMLTNSYMEKMAKEALGKKQYQKSYLFYSQLIAINPSEPRYRIAQAEAALALKRYSKVLDALLPVSSKAKLDSYSESDRNKIKQLIETAASKQFAISKE